MTTKIREYQNDLIKFLRSTDFSKAIVLTIAIVVPVSIFYQLDQLEIGVSIAMGCLLSSPSDVPGSFKHKVLGILLAAMLGAVSFCVAGYAAKLLWAIIPMLIIMIFAISYLSVYGFRASLVTFSGLLAIVLSFANLSSGLEIWQKSLLIGLGGIWYLIISISWYFIKPERATEQLLAETIELTAEYLRLRARLLHAGTDIDEIQKELFQTQNDLNEHHESLREILISSRRSSGSSAYSRKRLLVFIDLVDMLELAMANPVDYKTLHEYISEKEVLKVFADFNLHMAFQLESIAMSVYKNSSLSENQILLQLNEVENSLKVFRDNVDITHRREALLMLRNLFDYQTRQAQKINNIDRILRDLDSTRKLFYKEKDVKKFLTQQEYNSKPLLNNLNFQSAIFRHSLRLSIMVLIGYLIGEYFSVQNSYWILLTIVVIMRPNYGLTKQRTRKRIIGTLIGGAIAVGIVFLTQNPMVYAVLGILSLTLAFSLIQRNYTNAAIFITLSIVFIYALLQPEVLKVIQFRILDTLIGAGLAAFGNLLLWPKWESEEINQTMASSLEAIKDYLSEIDKYYHNKGKLALSYKLSRKKAFLEMGALSAAFQRMTQEPKSRQKNISLTFEIVSLNHTLLSALASLGTYIRTHPTTSASEDFEEYTMAVSENLKNAIRMLQNENTAEESIDKTLEAGKALRAKFDKLARERDLEIQSGKRDIDKNMRLKLQEAHLVIGQLQWLYTISGKLQKNIARFKSN